MYNFRTDMAVERREIAERINQEGIDGIEVEEKDINEKIKLTKVKVTNKNGEEAIGKPMRNLYNNRCKKIKNCNRRRNRKSSRCFIRFIKRISRQSRKQPR